MNGALNIVKKAIPDAFMRLKADVIEDDVGSSVEIGSILLKSLKTKFLKFFRFLVANRTVSSDVSIILAISKFCHPKRCNL